MKYSHSFTHNLSKNEFKCFSCYNNDDKDDVAEKLKLFNKLHHEYELKKERWIKFSVTYASAAEWEVYYNICLFRCIILEKMETNLLDLASEYCNEYLRDNHSTTYNVSSNEFVCYLFFKNNN